MHSPEYIKECVEYDRLLGCLIWKHRPRFHFPSDHGYKIFTARFPGKEALTATGVGGYKTGAISGKKYYAHRVVWCVVHGAWPTHVIDHIDGNPQNNRIENLRHVTQRTNTRNRRLSSNNTSGAPGVRWDKLSKVWVAEVYENGKVKRLGSYGNLEIAKEVRRIAEAKRGFHENHGRS